jgi:hypothetical protein
MFKTTRSRIILGYIGLAAVPVALALTRAAAPGHPSSSASYPYSLDTVRSNLQTISSALYTYANQNQDYLPPRLSMLYPTYISNPAVFWSPGDSNACPTTIDNDEPNQPNSAQVSFQFLGAGRRLDAAPFILVQDNSTWNNMGGGICAAISDGRVEFFMVSMAPLPLTETALNNLMQITLALGQYAEDNQNRLPPTLSTLYPSYVSDPKVFWNPGDNLPGDPPAPTTIDNDVPDAPNSAQISYTYLAANKTISDGLDSIVLQDNSPCNNGGAVVNILDPWAGLVSCIQIPWCTDAASCRTVAQSNLKRIGIALYTYAAENADVFPASLSTLYRHQIYDPTVFWNPGDIDSYPLVIDNDAPNQPNSTQISFAYFGGTTDRNQTAVVAQDNSLANNEGLGAHVLTADGQAEFFERCDRWLPLSAVSRANLQKIGQALQVYASNNNDRFPTKLSMLYPTYIADAAVFWSPGDSEAQPTTIDNDTPNHSNSAQISYHYLGASYTSGCNPGVILIEDNALSNNGGTGMNILTADGVAEHFAPAPPSCQFPYTCTSIAASNLRSIGLALLIYSNENADHLPTTLSMLYPHPFARPTVFWHPGDSDPYPLTINNDVLNQPNSAQISFEYLGSGHTSYEDPRTIVAQDNSPANNGGNGRLVLYLDGHVEYVPIRSVASVAVTSGPDTVPEGGTANYTCTATYDDATTRDVTTSAFWSVTKGPGSVSTAGTYTAPITVTADTPVTIHVIYVDEGGLTKEADKTITVQNTVRLLASIAITSGPDTVPEGGTANYTCTATYDDGSIQDVTASATWAVTIGPGSFPSSGVYTAPNSVVADTAATIRASYVDRNVTHMAFKNITVQKTTLGLAYVSISGPATVPEGGTAGYTCLATYGDNTTRGVTGYATWSIDGGPGSFSSPGIYVAPASVLANTPVTIRVSYTDSGVTKQTTKNITVNNTIHVLTGLSISSGPDTVLEGGSTSYLCTAIYDDGSTENVTSSAIWTAGGSIGSFSVPGTYTAPSSVTADTAVTLRATYTEGGVTRQADKSITVTNSIRVLASVSITSGPATVPEGGTGSYTCTATYDDATKQTVTASAVWSVASGPGSFTYPGTYAAPSPLDATMAVTITATYTEANVTRQASKIITAEKPSEPPPVGTDADGDGVLDSADRCPATPANTAVDANGCAASQRDTDQDGVTDDKDQCANTPSGTAVDTSGCPVADTDQDGVADGSDNCPEVANADQLDSDGDGVGNACDLCPDDANKTEPGNCGCGQPETADCEQPQMFTIRVISADGSSVPQPYAAGSWAQIIAPVAPEGMRFNHWSGDLTGSDNPAQVYVDSDKEITANYETCPIQRRLPCGAGTPVCALAAMLSLGLLRIRSRRSD